MIRLVRVIVRYLRSLREALHYRIVTLSTEIVIHKSCKIHLGFLFRLNLGGSIEIGEETEILTGVILATHGGRIKIGKRCSINPYTIIYGHGNTIIGDDVLIAGHCMIIPSNHIFMELDVPINKQGLSQKGIIIEDDVWIGCGCSIHDGVTIKKGSIIAAGAVVRKDTEEYSVNAGVPSKLIKYRHEM